MYRLPSALRAVFVEQTILYNLKLQLSDSADKFAAIKLVDKQLRHASSISCSMPLFSCLVFIGSVFSIYLNISGEKLGKPLKCKSSPAVSVSPILKVAGVGDTHNVAWISFVDHVFFCAIKR